MKSFKSSKTMLTFSVVPPADTKGIMVVGRPFAFGVFVRGHGPQEDDLTESLLPHRDPIMPPLHYP